MAVIEVMREMGLQVHEITMTRHEIYTADECFLTGTAAEVIPAVQYDRRLIGDGKPGKLTADIIKRFKVLANSTGTPVPYTA
jgi:branched-chain amino acid aminotransferase